MSKENSLEYWLDYIQTIGPKETDLELQRIKPIYEQLIKSKIVSKVIVVGGTNGKGTTTEFLGQLLVSKHKIVGTFTSPHLFNFNERIKINGKPVSDESIVESFKLIEENRGSTNLTYFDFSTLAALIIFNKSKVDYMVLEIGLGGRLDPVNIVDSDIAILTNVELDHQDWLGEDRESIGKEKADIFKLHKPVIIGQHEVPNSVREKTLETKNQTFCVGEEFDYQVDDLNKKWTFTFKGERQVSYPDIKLNSFSVSSISCALTAFCLLEEEVSLDMGAVFDSLDLKGRCELIDNRYLLDVSHNESSARYLSSFIERNFKDRTVINAVFGVMEDKDVNSILEPLAARINKWYVTSAEIERSMATKKLADIINSKYPKDMEIVGSVTEACMKAQEETEEGGLILIFGSFYTVAEAFPALKLLRSVA
jgi:dihydrofolate synthase/folylpolyglutamate synthase